MTEPPSHGEDDDEERQRRRTNVLLLLVVVALVVGGVWLVNVLIDMRKVEDCVLSGRRDCTPISIDGRQN